MILPNGSFWPLKSFDNHSSVISVQFVITSYTASIMLYLDYITTIQPLKYHIILWIFDDFWQLRYPLFSRVFKDGYDPTNLKKKRWTQRIWSTFGGSIQKINHKISSISRVLSIRYGDFMYKLVILSTTFFGLSMMILSTLYTFIIQYDNIPILLRTKPPWMMLNFPFFSD